MSNDPFYADGLEALLRRMTSPDARRCYASQSVDVTLRNGDIAQGTVFCTLPYSHPLPHESGDHRWPSRQEILARQ